MPARRRETRVGIEQRGSEYVAIARDDRVTGKRPLNGWKQLLDPVHQHALGLERSGIIADWRSIGVVQSNGQLAAMDGGIDYVDPGRIQIAILDADENGG